MANFSFSTASIPFPPLELEDHPSPSSSPLLSEASVAGRPGSLRFFFLLFLPITSCIIFIMVILNIWSTDMSSPSAEGISPTVAADIVALWGSSGIRVGGRGMWACGWAPSSTCIIALPLAWTSLPYPPPSVELGPGTSSLSLGAGSSPSIWYWSGVLLLGLHWNDLSFQKGHSLLHELPKLADLVSDTAFFQRQSHPRWLWWSSRFSQAHSLATLRRSPRAPWGRAMNPGLLQNLSLPLSSFLSFLPIGFSLTC